MSKFTIANVAPVVQSALVMFVPEMFEHDTSLIIAKGTFTAPPNTCAYMFTVNMFI